MIPSPVVPPPHKCYQMYAMSMSNLGVTTCKMSYHSLLQSLPSPFLPLLSFLFFSPLLPQSLKHNGENQSFCLSDVCPGDRERGRGVSCRQQRVSTMHKARHMSCVCVSAWLAKSHMPHKRKESGVQRQRSSVHVCAKAAVCSEFSGREEREVLHLQVKRHGQGGGGGKANLHAMSTP